MFLAMVWHARRRVDALRIAEGRAEERRSLLERQERFIHDASHELRTPVTIARGHLELLRDRDGCATSPELDVALDELGRIDAIIERLLLLATADQPDFLRLRGLELEPFLEDVFMRWSEVAPRAWRLGPLAAGRLRVDPDRLRAALDALIENAVKFTSEFDAIELRARRVGADTIAIEVRDEGRGVPAEALERIFHRFARADAARTRAAGGVGLGLAIVDAIAKGHGGRCTVQSTDAGSTFTLTLPGFTPAQARGHSAAGQRADAAAGRCAAARESPDLVRPVLHCVAGEQGRRGHHPGPHAGLEVAPDPGSHGLAAAVVLEAVEVEPERAGPAPTGGDPRAGPDRRTAHRASPRTGPAGRPPRPRRPPPRRVGGWSGRGSDGTPGAACSPASSLAERGAVRALEVRVLDDQRRVVGPALVVAVCGGSGTGAERSSLIEAGSGSGRACGG